MKFTHCVGHAADNPRVCMTSDTNTFLKSACNAKNFPKDPIYLKQQNLLQSKWPVLHFKEAVGTIMGVQYDFLSFLSTWYSTVLNKA
jgi:hypothetical protein